LVTSNIRSSVDIGSDGAASFGDKINLSNTTNADSWKAEIDSDANSVVVRRYDFIVDLQIKRMKNKESRLYKSFRVKQREIVLHYLQVHITVFLNHNLLILTPK
jgi:hypothetical protein